VAVVSFPRWLIGLPPVWVSPSPDTASTPAEERYAWVELPVASSTPMAVAAEAQSYVWEALPERPPEPAANPTTPAKVALGERLFFDPALSRDGKVACSSCHDVRGAAGGDGRATSLGIGGRVGNRNAPTVWNAAYQSRLFWDGRAASLEEQAKGPLVNPAEMGMPSLAAVEQRVAADPSYRDGFAAAFGAGVAVTIERIAEAIAAYERTLVTADTPYDRFVRGDLTALTPAQLRGMALFQSVGCVTCHAGPNFGAGGLGDGQSPLRTFPAYPTPDAARYRLTDDGGAAPAGSGRGVWRIPPLRNVALTGPWLHNGAVDDLAEVVRVMAGAQLGRVGNQLVWSAREKTLRAVDRPALSRRAIDDIVAFLHALSSEALAAGAAAGRDAM
jgi:cytochrome c peroxidase